MAKPEPDFSVDDLLTELQQALATSDDGWAMSELVDVLGMGRSAILRQLHILKKADRLDIVSKMITDITDRPARVRAYRLKAENDGAE